MAKQKNEDATDVSVAAFDSNKAMAACHGILASIVAAQEELGDAIHGRFQFKQRQRILAAGLTAAGRASHASMDIPRGFGAAPGVIASGMAPASDAMRREEIEALIEHRIQLGVDKALGEIRGQSGELREIVDQAVNAKAGQLEARLVSIVQETLTDSLKTLEESLEDRMREIAAAATTAAAERERVNKALDEARKAAEQGLKAASGDEILEQIEDVRDIRIDVGDYNVGDIEERGAGASEAVDASLDEAAAEEEVEAGEEEVEAGEEEVEAGEEEVEAGEEEIEAGEEEIEAGEEEIEAGEEEVEAAEEEIAAEEAPEGEDFGIEVDENDLQSSELEEIEVDMSGEADLDIVQTGDGEPLVIADDEADQDAEVVEDAGRDPIEIETGDGETEGVEGDPEAVNRYLELASKLRVRKNFPAAMELYIKVLELEADNFEAHVGLGAVHLQAPDFDAASEEFATALDIDPNSPAGYLGMGEVHFLKKEYSKAIKQYAKCLKLDSELAQAYCNRGLSYFYQKNHKKAFLDLQKAYRLDPEIPNIKKRLQMVMKVIKKQESKKG